MTWIPKTELVRCPNPECTRRYEPHMRYTKQGGSDICVWCPSCGIFGPKMPQATGRAYDDEGGDSDAVLRACAAWNQSFGPWPAFDKDMFFVASPKHSPVWGELQNWWGPANSGYTPDLMQAGHYTLAQIEADPTYYNDGVDNIAVPMRLVWRETRRMVTCRDPKAWKRLMEEDDT